MARLLGLEISLHTWPFHVAVLSLLIVRAVLGELDFLHEVRLPPDQVFQETKAETAKLSHHLV